MTIETLISSVKLKEDLGMLKGGSGDGAVRAPKT